MSSSQQYQEMSTLKPSNKRSFEISREQYTCEELVQAFNIKDTCQRITSKTLDYRVNWYAKDITAKIDEEANIVYYLAKYWICTLQTNNKINLSNSFYFCSF